MPVEAPKPAEQKIVTGRPDTLLLYGATDVGKTAQLGEIAKREWSLRRKISRLISADSGWDPIEDLIVKPDRPIGTPNPDGSAVCMEAWNIQGLRDPWVVLIELSEGSWPMIVDSPTGPRIKMMKPSWKDGLLISGGHPVGQIFIEGLNTVCTVGMQDHINTARKLSQDVVGTFSSTMTETDSGGKDSQRTITLSSAAMSHYGQVQRFLLDDLVPRFGKLSVERVIWTAHEARGKDDINEQTPGQGSGALGPATVGRAQVDKTTMKFGHTLHMTVETEIGTNDRKETVVKKREFRAWFISHPDDYLNKMKWPAKVSLSMSRSAELLKKFPGGFIPLTGGFEEIGKNSVCSFLDFLEGK